MEIVRSDCISLIRDCENPFQTFRPETIFREDEPCHLEAHERLYGDSVNWLRLIQLFFGASGECPADCFKSLTCFRFVLQIELVPGELGSDRTELAIPPAVAACAIRVLNTQCVHSLRASIEIESDRKRFARIKRLILWTCRSFHASHAALRLPSLVLCTGERERERERERDSVISPRVPRRIWPVLVWIL